MSAPIKNFSRADANVVADGNMGGLPQKIYLVRSEAIQSIPAPPAGSSTITDPIVFVDAATEVFATIYITKKTGNYKHEQQGASDGYSFKETIVFGVPTLNDKVVTMCNDLCNENLIAVAPDRNGQLHLVGSIDEPAEMEANTGDTGTDGSTPKMATFTITAETPKLRMLAAAPQTEVTV